MTKENFSEIAQYIGENQKPVPVVVDTEGKPQIVAVAKGLELKDLKPFIDNYRTRPERRRGVAKVTQLESFIAHANRFKDDDSVLFANNNMQNPSLTAVLDYHKATAEGEPRFGEHRTHYAFPLSKEWQAWLKNDSEAFSQSDFAAFIENRIGDILSPLDGDEESDEKLKNLSVLLGGNFAGPSTLVALSRGLQINETARVKTATNLSTGETSIVYENEHKDEAGAPVRVPNFFLIGVPVFESGDVYRIAVRLRYRVAGGTIKWFYQLYRIENVFDDAFDGACKKAAEETGLPLFIGQPE